MSKQKHLKPKQYYIDLYDKHTVDMCRRAKEINKNCHKPVNTPEDEIFNSMMDLICEVSLYSRAGERYKYKNETINDWMRRDEERDRFFENVKPPEGITCLQCGRLLFVEIETEEIGFDKDPDRMMYIYSCPLGHLPRRIFFDNGEEYKPKEYKCKKCGSSTKEESKREGSILFSKITCNNCGEVEIWEHDLNRKEKIQEEKIDLNLEADRKEYCLDDQEGGKYISHSASLIHITELMKEERVKEKELEENKQIYEKVSKIKKLNIIDLEKLLQPELEKNNFIRFKTKELEVDRHILLPFIVYESDSQRNEKESVKNLIKIINEVLEDTNWRLNKEVDYRLGMLSGKLRAYEKDEDIIVMLKDGTKVKL